PVDVRRGQPLLEALDLHVGIERADRLARRVDLRSPEALGVVQDLTLEVDRKSTRLNSSHGSISYAVFCLKKKSVSDQVAESARIGRFSSFLPPQVADTIVSAGTRDQLVSHSLEIKTLVYDLRGIAGLYGS